MSETLVWWVMCQVVGLAALPLCLALFGRLPDRGYALSKPFALLLLGYVFWVLNVMRVLPNTTAGIVWALLFVAAAAAWLFWRRRDELLSFARGHLRLIVAVEVLFFLAFVMAAYLRSYVPEIAGTEKPMDFMFLNAVTRAEHFPPEDPWLAGSNVAYYYFGYLIVSIMTRLSGLETSVGFNLGLAMIAALAVTGVFSLVYNLAAARETPAATEGEIDAPPAAAKPPWRPMVFGFAAGLLLVVMGNLEGLLEWFAAHEVGTASFWNWVGIQDPSTKQLTLYAYDSSRWYPDTHWQWWHATRILDGGRGIHEFPFFSFLLGDLHPHVMSIPFVLLAAGAALALLRSEGPLDLVYWLERPLSLVAFGLVLGGLSFLNTWDMPTMAFLVLLVALARNRLLAERWSWWTGLDALLFALPLYLVAFIAYAPFFFGGFDSQASGFTAEAGAGSGLFHTLLIWGPFAVLVLPYAVWRLSRSGQPVTLNAALWALAPAAAVFAVWLVWDGLAAIFGVLPNAFQPNEMRGSFGGSFADRGWNWLTALALSGALGLLVLAFVHEVEAARESAEERLGHVFALALAGTAALLILGCEFVYIEDGFDSRMNTIFKLYYQAWLLLSVAGGLALYELARGWRAPSVGVPKSLTFERSLGGWSLGELAVVAFTLFGAIIGIVVTRGLLGGFLGGLSLGATAFLVSGSALLLWRAATPRVEGAPGSALSWRGVWAGFAAVVLLAAFAYPLLATFNRTNNFNTVRSLDGLDYLKRGNPDEYAAIAYLAGLEGQPVIAEALGDDYSDSGRVSAATGLPTPLQWPGHQDQWRGTREPQAGRPEDLQTLYQSDNPDEVRAVIQKYGIRYVYVGALERQEYGGVTVPEMSQLFEPEPAFEHGEVAIYKVKPGALIEVSRE